MDTNVEVSVVINKLTSKIAQLSYDNAVLEAVNEQLRNTQEARDVSKEPVHNVTTLS